MTCKKENVTKGSESSESIENMVNIIGELGMVETCKMY